MDPEVIIAWLSRIYDAVMTALGLTQLINEKPTAVEAAPYDIEQKVTGIINRMPDPDLTLTTLLNAINAVRLDTASPHLATTTDILEAVQGVSTDVLAAIGALSIPGPAPSVGDIVGGVWGEVDPTSAGNNLKYGQEIFAPWQLASSYLSGPVLLSGDAAHFGVEWQTDDDFTGLDYTTIPDPDWEGILHSDTRLSWLIRTETRFDWTETTDGHGIAGASRDPRDIRRNWYFLLSELDFQKLRPPAFTAVEPIWPGIANVTLGTPVPLAETFSSDEYCHGVLLAVNTWPASYQTYDWGEVSQFPRAGYLSFYTDNYGSTEVRSFTFPYECIMVKGMARARGFLGRAKSGVEGEVTPFLINTP